MSTVLSRIVPAGVRPVQLPKLLGIVTLEILGFVLNPFNRTLQPARLLLA